MSKKREIIQKTRSRLRLLRDIIKPTSIRGRILIISLLISVTILILTVTFTNAKDTGSWQYTVGLSLSSSGVAATTVEIIIQATAKIDRSFKKRKFLKIFSYSDEDDKTDESIVIVIPAFEMKKIGSGNPSISNNALKSKAIENLSRSDTKAAIKNDIVTSASLLALFASLKLPTPQISWDEEVINFNDNQRKTYILIGLSNSQIDELVKINSSIQGQYFSVDTSKENNGFNSFSIKCGRFFDNLNTLRPATDWISYPNSSKNVDYAVFAKFKFNNKTLIVCGGTTEIGTRNIGLYISNHWERIYSKLEDEKGSELTPEDSFAVVVEVPANEQLQNFGIERVCIKKK
jgi:hypothetical protein